MYPTVERIDLLNRFYLSALVARLSVLDINYITIVRI